MPVMSGSAANDGLDKPVFISIHGSIAFTC